MLFLENVASVGSLLIYGRSTKLTQMENMIDSMKFENLVGIFCYLCKDNVKFVIKNGDLYFEG